MPSASTPFTHSVLLSLHLTMRLQILSAVLLGSVVDAAYKFEPLEHLAGISPYFEPEDPPLDPAAPQGCSITKAAYL